MKKRYIALAILGVAAAAAAITAACRNVSEKEQRAREVRAEQLAVEEFKPVLRFAVASDVHISVGDDARNPRLGELFKTAYAYAEGHKSYKKLDAVVLVGDITDSGSQGEYDILKQLVKENLREGTAFIPLMGNHDLHDTGEEGFMKNLDAQLDVHEIINGFHFIGLSPQPEDTWHTPKQILWMAGELHKAKKDDANKPIFTFQHGHIYKTVYVSRSWYTQMSLPLHAVYSMYPQVINFSGHSHGPINNPLEIWQSRYTTLGTGTLKYFEMERDISDNTVPAGSENAAQYLIVEVDANNRVRVMPYNLLTGDFFRTPATTDDANARLVFTVENPTDRGTFAYTRARKKTSTAPWFDENARLTVTEAAANSVTVEFDQAQANECVYGYRITIAPENEPKKTAAEKEIYSGYYFEPMPQKLSATLEGLEPGKSYLAWVTPLNVWLMEGDFIYTTFTTEK